MNICFLTHEYPPGKPGGIGIFTQTLARGLVKRGHRVTVIGNYPPVRAGVENDQGVRVIRLPNPPVPKTGFVINTMHLRRALSKVQKEQRIDILEGPNLSLAGIQRSFPASKVLRIHSRISTEKKPKFFRSWLIIQAFNAADHIVAVSHFSAETNRRRLRLGNRRIEVIPNPVDTSFFYPRPAEMKDDGLILFVGAVSERKGVRQLIQAMPSIVDSVATAHLLIVGFDSRDPETGTSFTARLRGLVPPALDGHITFQGAVDHSELPEIVARAQICVYPSHMENMPISWLEGMATGNAIVASNTGPGSEIVEDGVSGVLCDPHDPASIAEKVTQLLKDPDLRCSLGEQARKRVVEHFSLDVLVKKNEAFYTDCIRKVKASKP